MDMLGGIVGDETKQTMVLETIQNTLESIAEEQNLPFNEFFVTIKARDNEFNPVFHIFRSETIEGKTKTTFVRELTIKEIIKPPKDE